MMELV